MKILIVEDNKILSNNIVKYLELQNIQSKALFDGEMVVFELTNHDYDGVIMDLGLAEEDGIDIIKKIRAGGKNIPILILTSRDTIKDKVMGFQSGADDYLTKPFDYEELLLRIQALVRRNFSNKSEEIVFDDIKINTNTKEVTLNDVPLHLSKLEYDLLAYLLHYQGKVISKKELLEKIWGTYDDFFPSRTVDIYVGYIRKKLKKDLIQTIRGEGYMIK